MQTEQTFETGQTPRVRLESIGGNLTVRSWDEPRVWVRGGENLNVQQQEDTIVVVADSDCRIHVPNQAMVTLRSVAGDAQVTELRGALTIDSVSGNLRLADIGAASIKNVSGDLSVRRSSGEVAVQNVSGNGTFLQIAGQLSVASCGGDILARDVVGDANVRAGGDITLRLATGAGNVQGHAGGDVRCRIPDDFQGEVRLACGGDIRVKRMDAPFTRARQNATFALGEGSRTLTLRAGGDITLAGPRADDDEDGVFIDVEIQHEMAERAGELVQQVAEQIEAQVESLAQQLDDRLAAMGSGEEIAAKVQMKIQNVMRRAEEKINAATRRAEEQAKRAERRGAHRGDFRPGDFRRGPSPIMPTPPTRPSPPQPPTGPSDEERMQVLQMLEQGKISVEQAEQLLAAMSR